MNAESIPTNDGRCFPYFDGRGMVKGDPFAILRALTRALGGAPNETLQEEKSDQPLLSIHAKDKLIKAARESFELVPFDKVTGEGVLDEDARSLLDQYLGWLREKKMTSGPRPTSAPPSGPRPYSVPGLSPLSPASASGSTSNDCGCG